MPLQQPIIGNAIAPAGTNCHQPPSGSEGLMGLGIAGRNDVTYTPGVFTQEFLNQQVLVWLVFGPVQGVDQNCKYGVESTFGLPDNTWRLVSLPATPPPTGATLNAIFGDDIAGEYGGADGIWSVWLFDELEGAHREAMLEEALLPIQICLAARFTQHRPGRRPG